jgi:diguanylate cyclase (GGDEF)-like protein
MIDIDFFKKYNDTYGHQAGDECLRHVAALIAQQLQRPTDFFARYGGEEFAALLPGISEAGIRTVAQRLTNAVADARLDHALGIEQRVTISVGIAYDHAPAADASKNLRRADDALYRAKEAGRNRFSE